MCLNYEFMNYKIDASVIDLTRLVVRAGGGGGGGGATSLFPDVRLRARLDFMQSRIASLSVNGFSL